ncbi:MAG: tetratricopeptide repeat protein, partial [Pseudomonadota bacterium]
MSEPSFFSELWRRRVPQILGFYVAATWMAVEIGDWVIERFALPENLTSYVFIGMIAMLPTVAVVAWGHGAPGKDRWTRFQAAFVALNLAAATVALVMGGQRAVSSAPPAAPAMALTQSVEVEAEDGTVEVVEVPTDGAHNSLLAFFFANETGESELDWMSYGAPWLLAQDLRRSPLVSISTPLGNASIISRLRDTGFPQAVNEPLSLDLQIARDRGLGRIITGEIGRLADGAIELTARLIEVDTGQMLSEWSQSGPDWLDAADRLSADIRQGVLGDVDTLVTELTIKEHTSDNLDAIREVVEGQRLRAFENDYAGAVAATAKAVELDPTFAYAHALASSYYRSMGQFSDALEQTQLALTHDYKLYSETKFLLKANMSAMQGRADQAIWMLERWAKIHPQSAEVFQILGQNYLIAQQPDKSRQAYERLLELEPSQRKTLLSLATALRLEGKMDQAVDVIQKYIDEEKPENADALMTLGHTLVQAGEFERARVAFEEASFLDSTNPRAEVQLAELTLRQGEYESARAALAAIAGRDLPDRQLHTVLGSQLKLLMTTGQIRESIELLERMGEVGASFLTPLMQTVQVDNQIV